MAWHQLQEGEEKDGMKRGQVPRLTLTCPGNTDLSFVL